MNQTRELIIIVGSIVAALLIAVIITAVIIIGQLRAAAEQAEHTRIVDICEQQYGTIAEGHLADVVACMEDLKSR